MTKDEILQLSKECIIESINVSRMITSKPCYLFNINIVPGTAGTVAILNLRNGEQITAEILMGFKIIYGTLGYNLNIPLYFNKGLYMQLTSNISRVSFQYLLAH